MLSRLHKVVSRDMALISQLNLAVDQELIGEFRQALLVESHQIRDQLMRARVGMCRRCEMKRFVGRYQDELMRLSGRLLRFTEVHKLSACATHDRFSAMDILCQEIFGCISELLVFIERHLGEYVLWSAWIPAPHRMIIRHRVSKKLVTIEESLRQQNIAPQLAECVCLPLREFLQVDGPVTYSDLSYLLNFQQEVLNLLEDNRVLNGDRFVPGEPEGKQAGNISDALHELLFMLNYNTRSCYLYHVENLGRTLALQATVLAKLNVLNAEAKRLWSLPRNRTPPYNRRERHLIDMVNGWIRVEAEALERELRISQPAVDTIAPLDTASKTELGISVAVLAAGIRSLVGSKTFPDDNLTAMARMLSKCFTTLRSGGNFSVETFRQSYYAISDGSREKVIDILQNAISWLRRN